MMQLDEKSSLSFYLVGGLVLVTLWVGKIQFTGNDNAEAVQEAKADYKTVIVTLQGVREDLIAIKVDAAASKERLDRVGQAFQRLDAKIDDLKASMDKTLQRALDRDSNPDRY